MRKEYGDFWDKQRLIDACLELCENKWGSELLPKVKSNHSKITEIQIKRLQAVLKTHNIDYNFLTDDFDFSNSAIELSEVDEDLDEYLIMCSGIIHLVSYSISSEDLTELKKLINQNSRHAYLLDEKCHLECYSTRCVFFDEIFRYRKKIYDLEHCHEGFLLCPLELSLAMDYTDSIFEKDFKGGIEKLDRTLALLMGDNFKNPISVSELKAKYGYPPMLDSKLQNLIDESW